VLFMSHLI